MTGLTGGVSYCARLVATNGSASAHTDQEPFDQGLPFGTRLNAPKEYVATGFRNCKGQKVGDPGHGIQNGGWAPCSTGPVGTQTCQVLLDVSCETSAL